MKRLIYTGKRFELVECGKDDAESLTAKPRAPQKAAFGHRGIPYRLRDFRPISAAGNGYRPGSLLDLGPDQCRYTLKTGKMCGAKIGGRHPSYCDEHHAVCCRGRITWGSKRHNELAKPAPFLMAAE